MQFLFWVEKHDMKNWKGIWVPVCMAESLCCQPEIFTTLLISYFCCLVVKSCLTLLWPYGLSPPGSSVYGFPREDYWNGMPFPSPGDLPDSGIEPKSPALAGGFFTIWATREAHEYWKNIWLVYSLWKDPSSIKLKKKWHRSKTFIQVPETYNFSS